MTTQRVAVPHVSLRLVAEPQAAPLIRRRLAEFARANGAPEDVVRRVGQAVTEAVSNVVRHAYPGTEERVECDADVDEGLLEIVIADRGVGLVPSLTPGLGAGLALVADSCDDFTIAQRDGPGVEVWMRFVLQPSG